MLQASGYFRAALAFRERHGAVKAAREGDVLVLEFPSNIVVAAGSGDVLRDATAVVLRYVSLIFVMWKRWCYCEPQ